MILRRATLLLPCLLAQAAGAMGPVEIPTGTTLEIKLDQASGTRISQVGDPVRATLISPVSIQGKVILPAGLSLQGEIESVSKLGMGFKRAEAKIQYRFRSLSMPDGTYAFIQSKVVLVDTAKEQVSETGQVIGIRPTANISSSLSFYAWRLVWLEPVVAAPVWAVKFLFARSPDPEIHFPAGTEMLLQLTAPASLNGFVPDSRRVEPVRLAESREASETLDRLAGRRAVDKDGKPSDQVNVVLLGSRTQVEQAFLAAGWEGADRRSLRSIFRTYRSVVERVGYPKAPVNNLLLDGHPPAMVYQKSLNTFAKRHHGRIWEGPEVEPGKRLWAMAATEDTGISFSWKKLRWTHATDHRIDNERTKVVSDLLYTQCAEAASLLPPDQTALTSSRTDGFVAVLRLNDCASPRQLGTVEDTQAKWLVRAWTAFQQDLVRSNILFLGYNTTKLATLTKSYLTGKRPNSPRGTELNKQQADLLAVANPPVPESAPGRPATAELVTASPEQ